MKKLSGFISLFILLSLGAAGQPDSIVKFSNYPEMRQYFGTLYQEEKYEEAAVLLEEYIDQFPENLMSNSFNLGIVYAKLNQPDKGIEVLRKAHSKKVWFNVFGLQNPIWEPYHGLEAWNSILSENEALRAEAQKNATSIYEVISPPGYDKSKSYPLFIALHGGGGNIRNFKENWHSEKMLSEFITLYVQSSLVVSMDGYNWMDNVETSIREISEAFRAVSGEWNIDKKNIIIGGFSSGGGATLEVMLSDAIPARGFVVLCPVVPEEISEEAMVKMKAKGVRGCILTSELDQRVKEQEKVADRLTNGGIPVRLVVTPNIGHWFPEDFALKLDEAIGFISGSSK